MTESLKVEKQWKKQVRESDQLSYPVRQVASLDMVPERTPCPPAVKVEAKPKPNNPKGSL